MNLTWADLQTFDKRTEIIIIPERTLTKNQKFKLKRMLIEPNSTTHKRKYGFISNPADPETPQPALKKLKLDTLQAMWQDLNIPPAKNFGFKSLITEFEQVFQSAKTLHEFLDDNKDLLQPNKFISIPSLFLSPNSLQDKRFPKIDQFIDLTITKGIQKTLKELLESDKLDLYLRGPMGYGKSYLMALYTLLLRQKEHYRVLYVNNPEECRYDFNKYIANEFVYCFYRDFAAQDMPLPPEESFGSIPLEKWYSYLLRYSTDAEKISLAFKILKRSSGKRGKPLVFVLDQMEVATRCCGSLMYKSFAKSFYSVFERSNCHRRVASASANDGTFQYHNKKHIKEISKLFDENDIIQHLYGLLNCKILPEDIIAISGENYEALTLNGAESHEKTLFDIEFPFMMNLNTLKIIPDWKKDEKYEKLLAILRVTGDSPYELSKVVEAIVSNKKDPLEDILEKCFAESLAEFRDFHDEYRRSREYSQEQKINIFRAIIIVDTEKSSDHLIFEYDRNLISAVEKGWGYEYYTICPAVAKAFEKYYAEDFAFNQHILDKCAKFSIQHAIGAICCHKKDSTLTKFAIYEFRTRRVPHPLNYYFNDEQNQQKKGTIDILIHQFQYFPIKELEEDILNVIKYPFGQRQTLFASDSPNFKLIDCILLDHLNKNDPASKGRHRLTIYLFKITTGVNDNEKVDKIIKSDEESLFGCKHEICRAIKNLKNEFLDKADYELKFQFVWYTPEYLIHKIDFTKIHHESWVLGAKIFQEDE